MRTSLVLVALAAFVPNFAAAQIIISEVMYDTPGSDSKSEWVELQNTGTNTVDISKWKFNDGSNHVLNAPPKNGSIGSLVVPSGAYVLLVADAATFLASHAVSASVVDTAMSLGNDSGKLLLVDDAGKVVEKVSYSKSKGGDGTGESLQLIDGKFTHAKPTPGAVNRNEKIEKPTSDAKKQKPKKSATTKTTKADITKPSQEQKNVAREIELEEATSSAYVAAVPVGVPQSATSWAFGAGAVGVAAAAALLVVRQKRRNEWDIEEI